MEKPNVIRAVAAVCLILVLAGCGETSVGDIEQWKARGNVDKLVSAFDSIHQDIRLAAIAAVAELKAADAVDPLADLFTDTDQMVVHEAIDAVIVIGGTSAEKHVLGVLNFETVEARSAAAKAIGDWGVVEAVDPLISLLDDDQDKVSSAAAEALGMIGDLKAVKPLASKLSVRSYDLRMACIQSIRQIGGTEVAEALAPSMGDFSKNIRMAVVDGMVEAGNSSVPFALKALRSDGEFTRPSAVAILKGTGNVPTTGSDLVWYTLAGIPQDPKAKVDDEIVSALVEIEDSRSALLEAVSHPVAMVREYAFLALETIGEPAASEAVATAEQRAGESGRKWFKGRSDWSGAPSWRLDLWGAITALNPGFELNPVNLKTLVNLDADARDLLLSSQFKPTSEYTPLLIKQTATPPPSDSRRERKNAIQNKLLAEKKLLLIGSGAIYPLIAGLEDDDLSIASSCAKTLVKIDRKRSMQPLVESFTRKVNAGVELANSEFLEIVTKLDNPATTPLLSKVRPNDIRAIQIFENKYPDVHVSIIPMRFEVDLSIKAQPFCLSYLVEGKRKELRVVFRPNEEGEWIPCPPLPEKLP